MQIVQWILANYPDVMLAMVGIVGAAEIIVRLTPTKKDDGFVERIGSVIRKVMDFLKIPNPKSKK